MKIRFLLIGTSLSLIPTLTSAQCVATQDCATLGYTETSCSGGSGVKCPFGNKWACFKSESEIKQEVEKEFCNEYGFTLSCTGTNQTGGGGKACNGKYSECTCTSGYEWKDGGCQKIVSGAYGEYYFCDGKVTGVRVEGMKFFVALTPADGTYNEALRNAQSYKFCDGAYGSMASYSQVSTIQINLTELNNLLSANGGKTINKNSTMWTTSPCGSESYFDLALYQNAGYCNRMSFGSQARAVLSVCE